MNIETATRKQLLEILANYGYTGPVSYTATKLRVITADHVAQCNKPIEIKPCTINEMHCTGCGSTSHEDLSTGDQGYTACCNEPAIHNSVACRGHFA